MFRQAHALTASLLLPLPAGAAAVEPVSAVSAGAISVLIALAWFGLRLLSEQIYRHGRGPGGGR